MPWSTSRSVPWDPSSRMCSPALHRLSQRELGVGDPVLEAVGLLQHLVDDAAAVQRPPVVDLDQDLVLDVERGLDLLREDRRVEQVLHAHAQPRDLVPVGGADAPPGGADLGLAEVALGDPVDGDVVRHDQVRVVRDEQPARVDAALVEARELGEQHPRVDDDAVADDVRDPRREDPGRDQVQREGLPVRQHHGVARVVAALVAHDPLDALAVEVGRLALALVAPLRADEHHHGHGTLPTFAAPVLARPEGPTTVGRAPVRPRVNPEPYPAQQARAKG